MKKFLQSVTRESSTKHRQNSTDVRLETAITSRNHIFLRQSSFPARQSSNTQSVMQSLRPRWQQSVPILYVNRSFCRSHRTAAVFRQMEQQASMKHASPSGLYSSSFRLNPADIPFPLDVLTSICILIIRQILTRASSQENPHRNFLTVSGSN